MFGELIIALIGFVLPIFSITLSLFPEGIRLLKENYDNERKQAEENLGIEIKKKSEEGVDTRALSRNIAFLEATKNRAKRKLYFADSERIFVFSIVSLGTSLVAFLGLLYFINHSIYLVPFGLAILSIVALVVALIVFWNSASIIIEASSEVQRMRTSREEKILELLTALVDNSKKGDPSLFINSDDIRIEIDAKMVEENKEFSYSANKKHILKIDLINLSDYMWKTAELGFIFPSDVLLEDLPTISRLTTTETRKILRFNHEHLQANERMQEGSIGVTFLKADSFKIEAFIKGENVKRKSIPFLVTAVE